MATNDMYAVMYRIIAYLYDCMKRGEEPEQSRWDASALGIPEPYWAQIVEELVGHGFLAGIEVSHVGRDTRVYPVTPRVTMEGVAFAQENSMMGKARQFFIDAKASIPLI